MTNIGKAIHDDGVFVRWVRTAATTIIAAAGALGIIWGATVWVLGPRVNAWAVELIEKATADLRTEGVRTNAQIDRLDDVVARLEDNVAALAVTMQGSTAPSWRFSLPDTSISDGNIGGSVTIRASGWKLRECGVPRVDLYFVNGGGIYHRFSGTSLLSQDGRGVPFPVDPNRIQTISYTAGIPVNDNVTPGRAQGFISISYPDGCPLVQEAVAGPLQFRIGAQP